MIDCAQHQPESCLGETRLSKYVGLEMMTKSPRRCSIGGDVHGFFPLTGLPRTFLGKGWARGFSFRIPSCYLLGRYYLR